MFYKDGALVKTQKQIIWENEKRSNN